MTRDQMIEIVTDSLCSTSGMSFTRRDAEFVIDALQTAGVIDGGWSTDFDAAPKDGSKVDLLYAYPRGRRLNCMWMDDVFRRCWYWREPRWNGTNLLPEREWTYCSLPNAQPTHWRQPPALPVETASEEVS